MKISPYILIMLSIAFLNGFVVAQFNIVKLLDQAPLIPESFGTAFTNSKLKTSSETLDDGREFKRVKSWEPSYDLFKYSELLDTYMDKIDKRAESNSFELNYVPDEAKEAKEYLTLMMNLADSVKAIWKSYTNQIIAICPEFFPLSDEYGCDEIAASGKKLNGYAVQKNQVLIKARTTMRPMFDLLQRYFNKLFPIENAMFNNEVLNEISKPIQILQEWNYQVNVANSNMVETGISANNALCGR